MCGFEMSERKPGATDSRRTIPGEAGLYFTERVGDGPLRSWTTDLVMILASTRASYASEGVVPTDGRPIELGGNRTCDTTYWYEGLRSPDPVPRNESIPV